jgi:hypothetical protein
MISTRSTFAVVGVAATAAVLALPAVAAADVYCVDTGPAGCDVTGLNGSAGFQSALNMAEAHAGADTVRLGNVTYTTTGPDGFAYANGNGTVTIDGAGQAQTTIRLANPIAAPGTPTTYLGIEIDPTGNGSTISDLKVTMATPPDAPINDNQQYSGIKMSDGVITDVTVDGPAGVGINGTGIVIDSGTLTRVTELLPQTSSPGLGGISGASTTNLDLLVQDSTITADSAVSYGNSAAGVLTVRRSTLRPSSFGAGVVVRVADAVVENTVIDLGTFTDANGLQAEFANPGTHTQTISADGLTIVGTGAANSRGVRAIATDLNATPLVGDTSTVTLANSILDQSLDVPIQRLANNNGTANVTTSYSAYDPLQNVSSSGVNGAGAITSAVGDVNLVPGFVGGGDLHLAASSPLIDIGDPATPAAGALDRDGGPRAILGKPGCGPRRDIGAYEFAPAVALTPLDCIAPDTSASGRARAKVKPPKKRVLVRWTFASNEVGATFECSLDGGRFAACTSPFSAKLKKGPHTLTVRSKDAAGNQDQTPASFITKVKRKKPKPR